VRAIANPEAGLRNAVLGPWSTFVIGVICTLLCHGCASAPTATDDERTPHTRTDATSEAPESSNDDVRPCIADLEPADIPADPGWLVLDAETGCPLDEAVVRERLQDVRIAYAGEHHDQPDHHRFQAWVIATLDELSEEAPVLVGFEMFNPGQQPVLDRYSAGELPLGRFVGDVDWASSWGMDVGLYEPILILGAEPGVSFVGLNAERKWSKRVYEVGLDGLSPDERAELPPVIDDSNDDYRAFVVEALEAHMHSHAPDHAGTHETTDAGPDPEWEATKQRFFEAQLVWDETMAHNLVEALRAAPDDTRAVVVVGAGHVRHGWGIPDRVERMLPAGENQRDLLIACEVVGDDASPAELERMLDPDVADLFCVSRDRGVRHEMSGR